MAYRPKPVLRRYIPKPGSRKKRPLGLPSFEDKIVQKALTRVLEQIYEADFLDCSYGYRPDRTQHQALAKLGQTIQRRKVSWVVDADVQGFFDHLNQEWLLKFLEQRIGDKRVWRLVWRILKSGVMEDGLERASGGRNPARGEPLGAALERLPALRSGSVVRTSLQAELSGGGVSVSLRGRFPSVLSAPR